MMRLTQKTTGLSATLIAVVSLAWTASATASLESAEEIVQCMTANVPEQAFSLQVGLEAYEDDELRERVVLDVVGELGDQGRLALMTRAAAPHPAAGQRLLLRQDPFGAALHMMQPHWSSARAVPADLRNETFWATDVSLHELQEVVGLIPKAVVARGEDVVEAGRRLYVLDMHPAHGRASTYSRLVGRIDANTCLPVQLDLYGPEGRLSKQLKADLNHRSVEDGRLVVHQWTIRNVATPNRYTRVYLGDVRFDVNALRPARLDLRGLRQWGS
ncbi:MAG: hypothetical protein CMH65_12020 [Nevskiales bacterium]|nr:hypothetical protein [Nevskiales bacterium]